MDVTANLVTAAQLTAWMTAATGQDRANQDQWCYALAQITGSPCPNYDIGNGPTVLTTADDFLTGLRNFQLGVNASTQGPGGTSQSGPGAATPIPSATSTSEAAQPGGAASPTGQGLLGPTNCPICIWLASNWYIVAIAAVGAYFLFFYKKKG
jgi:hypothetical protein